MTNYNDGKWHPWNGGYCPVHPLSVVDIVIRSGPRFRNAGKPRMAETLLWIHDESGRDIVAFCVVKEYKEPREFWVKVQHDGLICEDPIKSPGSFKVREVLDDE